MSEKPELTIKAAQALIDEWIRSHGGYYDELTNFTRLTEEVGEMARIYARTRGQLPAKPGEDLSLKALEQEMGDVLFVLLCLANQSGIDLSTGLGAVLEKYSNRDQNRH